VDQSLLTVESDKASMEIPSSHAGVVKEVKVKVGDKVAMGSIVLVVEPPAALPHLPCCRCSGACPCCSCGAGAAAPAAAAAGRIARLGQTGKLAHASPSIRKFARELGVDLGKVPAPARKAASPSRRAELRQGRDGRHRGRGAAGGSVGGGGNFSVLPWPSLDFSKFGETELLPLSRIKKISGPTCTATGCRSRTSRSSTTPTSPTWKPSALSPTTPMPRTRTPPS
jgi:pyruvate dehydrogenase E2 component (dihydrolipoamide acetyltransferase)